MASAKLFGICLALLTACGGKVVVDGQSDGGPPHGGNVAGDGGAGMGGSQAVTVTTTTGFGGQTSDILDLLNSVPGLELAEDVSEYDDYRWFVGTFEQPADHDDPDGLKFQQRVFILHKDTLRPTVLNSTGYGLWDYDYLSEPALIAEANQISIEHRFFPPSRPEPADWQLLTIEQAAADHHRLVEALKPIYDQSWLSTGASKGGMTSMYHRRYYPDDVDGTIPYVAPLSYGVADSRYIDFLDDVGTVECREALKAFQLEVLSRRAFMLPFVEQTGANLSYWGADAALDFAVQNVRFGLWQYGEPGLCEIIPSSAAPDVEIFSYLQSVSAVEGSDDYYLDYFEPYYFQAAVQLGAPGSDESYLAPFLTVPLGLGPRDFVQPGPTKEMVFQPQSMVDIQAWTLAEGDQLLFVYGEVDPWTAGAFEVPQSNDSFSFVAPGQNHGAGIYALPFDEQQQATDAVLRWAGLNEVFPSPPLPARVELARVARLIDSSPSRKMRARLGERAREIAHQLRK